MKDLCRLACSMALKFAGEMCSVFLPILRCAIIIFFFLTAACSSTSKKQISALFPHPPALNDWNRFLNQGNEQVKAQVSAQTLDEKLESYLKANPSEEMKALIKYRQAKLGTKQNPQRSCSLWLEISQISNFPLMKLAQLHALETCSKQELGGQFASHKTSTDPWLHAFQNRAQLNSAIRNQDRALEMKLGLDVAPTLIAQSEQIKLLDRTRNLAKELGDTQTEESTLKLLQDLAPRFINDPTPEQFIVLAADFRRARDYSNARMYYEKSFARPLAPALEKLRALDGIRMTYKLESENDKFLNATRMYSDFARLNFYKDRGARPKQLASQLGKYFDSRLTLARAIWTENSANSAKLILESVERELRGRYPIEESLFLRSRIEEEAGRLDVAAKILTSIDDAKVSDKNLRQKISWFRAWVLRKSGRLKEASSQLEKLISEDPSSPLSARNRYWLARTQKDLGDTDVSSAGFQWLIDNDPIGYYGLLAYRELGKPIPTFNPPEKATAFKGAQDADTSSAFLGSEESLTFEWLIATEEFDLAVKLLDQLGTHQKRKHSELELLQYLHLYARAGAYQSLFARLAELSSDTRKLVLERSPDLIFPQPWQIDVETSGNQFNVEPEIVFSIIRQESSFNPQVRSSADAFGLMQLLPNVAQKIAPSIGIEFSNFEDLYQPELNIKIGTSHVKDLFRNWNNQFIPAIASYNASERAVKGWLKTRSRKDPIAFIEDIPYEETKGYVKLVLRNYVFYSRLRSSTKTNTITDPKNGTKFISFPEWCLNGIQDTKL